MEEAWEAIRRGVEGLRAVDVERASLAEACGRVLARPVLSDDDYPAFDRSMMDGFAVRSADCASSGTRLRIRGLIIAGQSGEKPLGPGETLQINTGAPLPTGADAVIRIEDCTVEGDTVTLGAVVKRGQCIAVQGGDRRRGDAILTPPIVLGPSRIAAAATAGAATVEVAKRVEVAIVSTGDELVRAGEPRRRGQIYDSNGPMLTALMREFGAAPREATFAPDEPDALAGHLREALTCPIVLTVGGMSMGTHDLVPQGLAALGVEWRFHGVNMRPGKPAAYGVGPEGQQVFGLPGNPVSAFVCAWLFARMAVRAMLGFDAAPPTVVQATAAVDIKAHRDPRPAYVPARVSADPTSGLVITPTKWSGSSDPFGLADANGLLYLANPTEARPAGSSVSVVLTSPSIDYAV